MLTERHLVTRKGPPELDPAGLPRLRTSFRYSDADLARIRTGRDVPRETWTDGIPPADLATTVPGIFAAGDIRSGSMKRVASASGEGASVVSLVHSWLA